MRIYKEKANLNKYNPLCSKAHIQYNKVLRPTVGNAQKSRSASHQASGALFMFF
jgi:hypothetical protein